MRGDR